MRLFGKKNSEVTVGEEQGFDTKCLEDFLRQALAGDLSARLELPNRHPLKPVADLANQFIEQQHAFLVRLLMDLNDTVYQGVRNAELLNELALRFNEMTKNIEQVLTAVDELSNSISSLSDSTNKTAGQASLGEKTVARAEQSVNGVAQETSSMQVQVVSMNDHVDELHHTAANIDSLVAVVNGISEQTNLLALNASIEAARAGVHGRGFSVVAEEVRKLADQSKQSVGQIKDQLNHIRSAVETINSEFKDMGKSFDSNVDAVQIVKQDTETLIDVFGQIGEAIHNLAPIAEEQSASFEEMNATLRAVTGQIGKLNETTRECNETVYQVLREINGIRGFVGKQNLRFDSSDLIDLAKTDHLIWKARVNQMLWGHLQLNAADVRDHKNCRLGCWYYREGKELFGQEHDFVALEDIHRRFHQQCAEAIEAYHQNNKSKADQCIHDIGMLSNQVFGCLDRLKVLVKQ